MRVAELLLNARLEFDASWRVHSIAMRAARLIGHSAGIEQLQTALHSTTGFKAGFDAKAELADLFEDLNWLRESAIEPLRRNCLLGVSAGFEGFAKKVAAALELTSQRKAYLGQLGSQVEVADDEFRPLFEKADRAWYGKYEQFLGERFPWLGPESIKSVADVLWVRNQFAHNDGYAHCKREVVLVPEPVRARQKIILSRATLAQCIRILRDCADTIIDRTSYLDAIR